MIDRECYVCKEYIDKVVTVRIFDDKEYVEYPCHEKCANELYDQIQNVKDLEKKPVAKVIKELKL